MRCRIFIGSLVVWMAASAGALEIREVRVESIGPVVVDATAVEPFTGVRAGQQVRDDAALRDALARDVKQLRESGRFAFVSADAAEEEGAAIVIYRLRAKPRVSTVEVSGNEAVPEKKIKSLLGLKEGDYTDDLLLAGRLRELKEYYHKHHYPYVDAEWELVPQEDGSAAVRVTVSEGPKMLVRRIEFAGATVFQQKELRKVMTQKERNLFSWLTGRGTYKPEALEDDLAALRRLYQDKGYLDAEFSEPEFVDEKKHVLRITINEGPLYTLGSVTRDESSVFSAEEVDALVSVKAGDTAAMAAINRSAEAVEELYTTQGYLRSAVQPVIQARGGDEPVVDVNFRINEGRLSYIRTIEIEGNTRTRDKVIRRELAVFPGDVFDRKRVEVSVNRLKNLGYFSDVRDVAEPLEERDQYDLAFQVEEKSTGQFMVGGGISSIDSVVGFVEISQGNFDLKSWPPVGGGQKARVRAQLGSRRQDAEISFVEPWFMDRRLSLGLDLFYRESSYYTADYDQTLAGFRVSLARPLTTFDRVSLSYSLENYDIDVDNSASPELQREDGTLLRSGLQLEFSHDTRDNYFIPRRGNRTVASAGFTGGPLLGDVDIYGMELRSSHYWPLLWDHVFNIRGSVQTVDVYSGSRVPIFDRLFLGGARTVRAFEYQEVGPVDSRDDPIGGRTLYYTTLEYTVPIWNRIRGATFYDLGFVNSKAYDFSASGLNSGVGIGIRFDMPGFPLNLDYAWPIQSEDYNDRGGRFSFQIGYMF